MRVHEYESELWLPVAVDELFPFFADATNLDGITPPWLHFRTVTTPPITMREGTVIDYRLRVHSVPVRWRSRIKVWQPPHRFIDEQIEGPYRRWIHEHLFETRDGGTLVTDRVSYAVPMDWLVHAWLVRPDIERIFRFRAEALHKHFGGAKTAS